MTCFLCLSLLSPLMQQMQWLLHLTACHTISEMIHFHLFLPLILPLLRARVWYIADEIWCYQWHPLLHTLSSRRTRPQSATSHAISYTSTRSDILVSSLILQSTHTVTQCEQNYVIIATRLWCDVYISVFSNSTTSHIVVIYFAIYVECLDTLCHGRIYRLTPHTADSCYIGYRNQNATMQSQTMIHIAEICHTKPADDYAVNWPEKNSSKTCNLQWRRYIHAWSQCLF